MSKWAQNLGFLVPDPNIFGLYDYDCPLSYCLLSSPMAKLQTFWKTDFLIGVQCKTTLDIISNNKDRT